MPVWTRPPYRSVAPRRHLLRCESPVQGGVPLGGHLRSQRRQIVEAGEDGFSGAVGTAATVLGAGGHRRLPFVPLGAQPPALLPAAVGYLPWRQRPIFNRVSLGQQGQLVPLRAVFVERGPQSLSPPITMYLRLKARQPAVSFSASLPKLLE